MAADLLIHRLSRSYLQYDVPCEMDDKQRADSPLLSFHTSEYICDTSITSSNCIGGKIDGSALERSVFHEPGAQIISTLCHHAAAIISARFAIRCPLHRIKICSCISSHSQFRKRSCRAMRSRSNSLDKIMHNLTKRSKRIDRNSFDIF